MNKIDFVAPEDRCSICGKKRAVYLCDCPAGVIKTSLSWGKYKTFCNRPICTDCATKIADGVHFCSHCIEKIKKLAGKKVKQ